MLSKRPEISSLITGFMVGIASLIISTPDIAIAITMACTCALVLMTDTSEKKAFIFLAGGVAVALISFSFAQLSTVIEASAATAIILAATFYISEVLSK